MQEKNWEKSNIRVGTTCGNGVSLGIVQERSWGKSNIRVGTTGGNGD